MDPTALVVSSGWASGVNAYATVAVLSLMARYTDAPGLPEALARGDVLAVAVAMFSVEVIVDKIPYLDSVWDGISTVIRPAVGAILGAQFAVADADTTQLSMAALGGGTALASHAVKSALRLAVNTSPEPVSNGVVSVTEDVAVVGVVSLAVAHPWWSAGIAAALLALGLLVVILLWRTIRRAIRRLPGRSSTVR